MNNNFDENREFVRRPSAQQTQPGRSQNPGYYQSRPAGGAQRPARGNVARPAQRPQASPGQRETRMPSQMGGDPRRQARPGSQTGGRIPPDRRSSQGDGRGGASVLCLKNILMFFGMLIALLLLVGFIFFSALSTSKETPESVKKSYTVQYYKGTGEDATFETYSSYELGSVSYISMTSIAEICGMTVSGSQGALRFGSGDNEYAEFSAGKSSATINGENVTMTGNAIERDPGSIWIPLDFARDLFSSGVEIAVDDEKNIVTVKKVDDVIKFAVKGATGLGPVDEDPDIGQEVDLGFLTYLDAYEKYMNPENRDDFLLLVNKKNSIDGSYVPEKLTPVENTRTDRAKQQMVETAAKALEAMFIELNAAGFTDLSVTSAYRSYSYQETLFNSYFARDKARHPDWTDEQVRENVLTYSAAPGTSEHQTGLCCDMHNLPSADIAFAQKEAYTWLKENCWKFGFIIRFPEDKVEITGYSFEPWHYRFVGRYHANAMRQRGMCLEEYIEYLNLTGNN